jgi:F0F1-type ATP synthase membrane subunit a
MLNLMKLMCSYQKTELARPTTTITPKVAIQMAARATTLLEEAIPTTMVATTTTTQVVMPTTTKRAPKISPKRKQESVTFTFQAIRHHVAMEKVARRSTLRTWRPTTRERLS